MEGRFPSLTSAVIAQLGERQTEDLKVPGSIRVSALINVAQNMSTHDVVMKTGHAFMLTRCG